MGKLFRVLHINLAMLEKRGLLIYLKSIADTFPTNFSKTIKLNMKIIQILPFYVQYTLGLLQDSQLKEKYLTEVLQNNKNLNFLTEPYIDSTSKRKFLKELNTLNINLLKFRKTDGFNFKQKQYLKLLKNLLSQFKRYINSLNKENFVSTVKELTQEQLVLGLQQLSKDAGSITRTIKFKDIRDKSKINTATYTKLKIKPEITLLQENKIMFSYNLLRK